MLKKKVNGFVTVEYTLLMFILMIMYIFLVYIAIYMYDACVMESNTYILGVEGSHLYEDSAEDRVRTLMDKEKKLYLSKYILMEDVDTYYQSRGALLQVKGSGKVPNPLAGVGIGEDYWELSAEAEIRLLHPARVLHTCKNLELWGSQLEEETRDYE